MKTLNKLKVCFKNQLQFHLKVGIKNIVKRSNCNNVKIQYKLFFYEGIVKEKRRSVAPKERVFRSFIIKSAKTHHQRINVPFASFTSNLRPISQIIDLNIRG
jgi:hypothetical protein